MANFKLLLKNGGIIFFKKKRFWKIFGIFRESYNDCMFTYESMADECGF